MTAWYKTDSKCAIVCRFITRRLLYIYILFKFIIFYTIFMRVMICDSQMLSIYCVQCIWWECDKMSKNSLKFIHSKIFIINIMLFLFWCVPFWHYYYCYTWGNRIKMGERERQDAIHAGRQSLTHKRNNVHLKIIRKFIK